MNAGYVRLSRDDDRRNYVSIENQKLLICQYARDQGTMIHLWYEDDGVSGYLFNRPGLGKLLADLDDGIDTVYVKDFSRLGRHNARVLLLLDELRERGKRLIAIDDGYDSASSDDDLIGIQTWFNERYVKDTSKKIRRAVEARQRDGSLVTQPPFGYRQSPGSPRLLEIAPQEAKWIRRAFELYLSGFGFRKIAEYLTALGAPTPSMARRLREASAGRAPGRPAALRWSDRMVKDLLENDFYMGTLRLHKRTRVSVHGKDRHVPRKEQYVFENHHQAIVEKEVFEQVQAKKEERIRTHYRGNPPESANGNLFRGLLFCQDCKSRLTPLRRGAPGAERRYYICSTYNAKGPRFCPKAHLVGEKELVQDVLAFLALCRAAFEPELTALKPEPAACEPKACRDAGQDGTLKQQALLEAIAETQKQLQTLLGQKVLELSCMEDGQEAISQAYDAVQKKLLTRLESLETAAGIRTADKAVAAGRVKTSPDAVTETGINAEADTMTASKADVGCGQRTSEADAGCRQTVLDILDDLLSRQNLTCGDIPLLVERIEAGSDGIPVYTLRHRLSPLLSCSPAVYLNRREHQKLAALLRLILTEQRGYTSARALSRGMAASGGSCTRQSLLPYLRLLEAIGVLKHTENSRAPYAIRKSREGLTTLMEALEASSVPVWSFLLHGASAARRYAPDGIRVYPEAERH